MRPIKNDLDERMKEAGPPCPLQITALLISTKPLYAEARLNFDGEKFNILNQV
jgi:hypothetical protein